MYAFCCEKCGRIISFMPLLMVVESLTVAIMAFRMAPFFSLRLTHNQPIVGVVNVKKCDSLVSSTFWLMQNKL